jgi:hypothetical protein
MDPTETAGAEGALKVKVGETVSALLPTLVREGLCQSSVIDALSPFATLAGALGGYGTTMFDVCVCCGGKWETRERLLGLRFLVTVSEMAKFVCHAPNHNQGVVGRVEEGGEDGESGERRGSRKVE